jgi:hypothetical protein
VSIFPNSNEPDIYTIKPEPTQRVKDILYAELSQKNKFILRKTLTKEEDEIRSFILTQTPILGEIPSIDIINKVFSQFPEDEIDTILDRLDQMDYIHLNSEKTAIDSSYPFSGIKTSHIVTVKKEGYKMIYAMCAIDALGVCFMLDCDVSIESKCNHCNDKVEIEIKNNEIISFQPKNLVVWFDQDYSCCAATSCCPNTNFFSSKKHFDEWQHKRTRRKGDLIQLSEAFYLGKLFFENKIK